MEPPRHPYLSVHQALGHPWPTICGKGERESDCESDNWTTPMRRKRRWERVRKRSEVLEWDVPVAVQVQLRSGMRSVLIGCSEREQGTAYPGSEMSRTQCTMQSGASDVRCI